MRTLFEWPGGAAKYYVTDDGLIYEWPGGKTALFCIVGAYIYRLPVPEHEPKPEFYIAGKYVYTWPTAKKPSYRLA